VDRDHRVKCNRCGFVFYEEAIRVDEDEGEEQCLVCGATGYLIDMPKLKEKPRWETPEQWKQRTGKKLLDKALVWFRYRYGLDWTVTTLLSARKLERIGDSADIVVVNSPYPPPDDWRPEEEK
jgi:rubredoxin